MVKYPRHSYDTMKFLLITDLHQNASALEWINREIKDNGVDFEKWLGDVLLRLDTCPASDIKSLLPHNWKPSA